MLKKLYNYESDDIHGIDLVAPLLGDGLVCFINTKDLIGWKIFFYGEYEAGTNRVIQKYVKKGDVVIEAGSNIGSETVILSKLVGETGRVYGFEPNPYTFDRLKINVLINEQTNVYLSDVALGEKNDTIQFNIYPKGFCNPGMSSKYMATNITKKIDVKQQTLDSYATEHSIPKIDFLKMDIQGAEIDLLNGAQKVIAQHKPIIFTEADRFCLDMKQLYEAFTNLGYKVYLIENDHNILMPGVNDIKEGNWLAIHSSKNQ
jgi:FkbM family methyltransferase